MKKSSFDMRQGVRKKNVLLLLAFFILPLPVVAITLTLTGNWVLNIDETDIPAGAGGDLTSTYYSASNELVIDVTDCLGDTDNWEIQVHKTDVTWYADLKLALLRTDDGVGTGTILGGDGSYLELNAADQYFFEGGGDRTNIDIQLRLSGVSVLVPADTYNTTIVFTLLDTP